MMNIQPIVDLAKANPEKFYVSEDNFVLHLASGTLIAINFIDDTLIGRMPKDRIQMWRRDVELAVRQGEVDAAVLELFDKKYLS